MPTLNYRITNSIERYIVAACLRGNQLLEITFGNATPLNNIIKLSFWWTTALQLLDIYAVDYPLNGTSKRFELNYVILELDSNTRIRFRKMLAEHESIISLTSCFPSANWLEREVWDMFGILFSDHPDLRRILSDYGFEGFPLRKDFPLSGYVQVRLMMRLNAFLLNHCRFHKNFVPLTLPVHGNVNQVICNNNVKSIIRILYLS
jgi:NADH:ubiquinone oxidoreductase subunit C